MKSALLFIAITLGLLLPELSYFSQWIRCLVMLMLGLGFLTIKFKRDMLSKELLYVTLANLTIPIPVYFLASYIGERQAEAAFVIAAAPAAIAAPIVIGFIKKRTDFVSLAVIMTNFLPVLILPLAIPLVATRVEPGGEDTEYTIILSVMVTIILPLLIAIALRLIGGVIYRAAVWSKRFTLYLWLSAMALACAKARDFVSKNDISTELLISIAGVSAAICIVNFGFGYLIGGKKFARESSQSLGQKNTMFAVWVGLTFFNPISVIAPVAYIIFQNVYNAFQILVFEIQEKRRHR